MSTLLFAAALCVSAAPAPGGPVEEGALEAAFLAVLDTARDPVRVAVAPVIDENEGRARLLSERLARLLLVSGDVEVVTPGAVQAALGEAAEHAARTDEVGSYRAFAADHVLLSEVTTAGGQAFVELRLLHVESGEVLGQAQAPVGDAREESSVDAQTVKGALKVLATDLVLVMDRVPGDVRYTRLAVAPLEAQGQAAQDARLDRFVQAELTRALAESGFLVVERERLDTALEQISVGELLSEEDVPALGKALDAQAVVLGTVVESGESFTLNVRVVSVRDGDVVGAASTRMRRDNAVTLASDALETRTTSDAVFRSLVVPGWGQLYNRQPLKGALFAAATYGAAALTLVSAGAAATTVLLYQSAVPDPAASPGHQHDNITTARYVRDGMVIATGALAVGTAALWGTNVTDALVTSLYPE